MPTFVDGSATALLTYASHSLVACCTALVGTRLIRRPQDRDVIWKATLIAPLLTAGSMMILSSTGRGFACVDLANLLRRAMHGRLPGRQLTVRVLQTTNWRDVFRQINDPVTTVLSTVAVAVAACCVLVALLRFVLRRRILARALGPRRIVSTLECAAPGRAIELSVADDLQSPVAFGNANICLPANVLSDFSNEHRDALVAHELAHLQRRDPAWIFVAEVVTAVSAFQPTIFLLSRAFRRDVELICDEAALHRTANRQALIGALALLASPFDPRSPLSGAATAYDGSPLVSRAERIASVSIEDASTRRHRVVPFAVAGLIALLCGVPVVSSAGGTRDIPIDPIQSVRQMRAAGRTVVVDSMISNGRRRVTILVK